MGRGLGRIHKQIMSSLPGSVSRLTIASFLHVYYAALRNTSPNFKMEMNLRHNFDHSLIL